MRSNRLSILVAALVLVAGSLAVAGCGGEGSASSAAKSSDDGSATSGRKSPSKEQDCSSLGDTTQDLQLADATGGGFEYTRDRDFMDDYADRAPDDIADSVNRLRDVIDKFASAAEKAGLAPGNDPLPDQTDKIKDEFSYSDDEQADNARAVQTIDTWVSNGCES